MSNDAVSLNDTIYELTNELWEIHLRLNKPNDEISTPIFFAAFAPQLTTSVTRSGFTRNTANNSPARPSNRS